MDFDNRKVYGDTSITDGLVFLVSLQKEKLGRGLEGLGLVKKEHKTLMSAEKKDVKYNFGKGG